MVALRADFEVDETYSYKEGPPLDCPISAFGGIDDHDVSQADLAAWKTLTSQEFSLQMMEGDHFFIFRSPDFLHRLSQELKRHQQEAQTVTFLASRICLAVQGWPYFGITHSPVYQSRSNTARRIPPDAKLPTPCNNHPSNRKNRCLIFSTHQEVIA